MPGFLRSIAQAAIDGYVAGKQAQGQSQQTLCYQGQYQQGPQQGPYHPAQAQQAAFYQSAQGQTSNVQSPSASPMQYAPPPNTSTCANAWSMSQSQYLPQQQMQDNRPPPPPYEPVDSHPSAPQSLQQHLPQAQAPMLLPQINAQTYEPKAPEVRITDIPVQRNHQSSSPGCNGFETIQGGISYVTSAAPDIDFCPSCYQRRVAASPFSARFTQARDTSQGRKTCDMAFKGVRDAWNDACARASSGTAQDREIWLQHFAQQSKQLIERIQVLVASITALKEEVQIGQLQVQFAQKSSMMQISHGMSMQAISSVGGSYSGYTNGYSLISAAGNNRFADAQRMSVNVHMKEYELQKLVVEFRAISGSDENGKATWS